MPVADYATYCTMLERARKGKFAYPAVNVTSLTTANAVLKGLSESGSDGIIQVSTGGAAFASGTAVKDMVLGAISIAEHVHRAADRYPIHVALHTDHCTADKLDTFVLPLVEETERRRAAGRPNLFSSHMFDGSTLPLDDNLDIAARLRERFRKNDLILEIEVGAVGGEEDGLRAARGGAALHDPGGHAGSGAAAGRWRGSVPARRDVRQRARRLQAGPREAQAVDPAATARTAVVAEHGEASRFYFVFHGGSGSDLRDIHEALDYGVVKMNVDTDMQYAFTRAVADHFFRQYDGVLRVDGEVGNKKAYDPRSYLALAEQAMADRVKRAAVELRSAGTALATS